MRTPAFVLMVLLVTIISSDAAFGHVPDFERTDFNPEKPFRVPSIEQSIAVYAWLKRENGLLPPEGLPSDALIEAVLGRIPNLAGWREVASYPNRQPDQERGPGSGPARAGELRGAGDDLDRSKTAEGLALMRAVNPLLQPPPRRSRRPSLLREHKKRWQERARARRQKDT